MFAVEKDKGIAVLSDETELFEAFKFELFERDAKFLDLTYIFSLNNASR